MLFFTKKNTYIGDGSDERNCKAAKCSSGGFLCKDGNCISSRLVCDGAPNCAGNHMNFI